MSLEQNNTVSDYTPGDVTREFQKFKLAFQVRMTYEGMTDVSAEAVNDFVSDEIIANFKVWLMSEQVSECNEDAIVIPASRWDMFKASLGLPYKETEIPVVVTKRYTLYKSLDGAIDVVKSQGPGGGK